MKRVIVSTLHYRQGRLYEAGSIVEIPDDEKLASFMTLVDPEAPAIPPAGPKLPLGDDEPKTFSEIQQRASRKPAGA